MEGEKYHSWSHTFNSIEKTVEITIPTKEGHIVIDVTEKDLRRMKTWYDLFNESRKK